MTIAVQKVYVVSLPNDVNPQFATLSAEISADLVTKTAAAVAPMQKLTSIDQVEIQKKLRKFVAAVNASILAKSGTVFMQNPSLNGINRDDFNKLFKKLQGEATAAIASIP